LPKTSGEVISQDLEPETPQSYSLRDEEDEIIEDITEMTSSEDFSW
jgi:hypothetical protein